MYEPDTLVWHKSTFSAGNGACVEVAWRKSSYSGACVEVATIPPTHQVRDSKNPTGPTLTLPTPHWRQFILGV